MRSHLVRGRVRHRRSKPFIYELDHEVFYFALDLSELDEVARRHRSIRRNGRGLFSFRDADHWTPAATDLEASVHAHLRTEGFEPHGWQITLVTNLRTLGHVFNPASFYLCRDAAGAMRVIIVEVHNTHGDRILYTLRPDTRGTVHSAGMDKEMYVSPFISMDAQYAVRVRDEADRLQIVINQSEHGEPMFQASLALTRTGLTDGAALRMLVRYPMLTVKTIAMIHVHAFRLWRKGAKFHSHSAAAQ